MEPLLIKSKSNTKLKSILWGTFFILLGLAMEACMIGLIVTEGFSVIWVFGMLVFTIFIWVGFICLHMRKYPLELLADDQGIHYFEYDSKFGYGKHEMIISWETITTITQYVYDELDPEDCEEALAIYALGEPDDPLVIWLEDADMLSDNIDDVVSRLNEIWWFYSRTDGKTQQDETDPYPV